MCVCVCDVLMRDSGGLSGAILISFCTSVWSYSIGMYNI